MNILLIGNRGQVGQELENLLPRFGHLTACDQDQCDLADAESIRQMVRSSEPGLIVNAAAYTAVDRAEKEPDLARAVNTTGPAILAEEAARRGAALVHYSTDYVFDGTGTHPYSENDPACPVSVYGKTKWEGDQAVQDAGIPHLILRTSWVYGQEGQNFLNTIRRLAQERKELRIVNDQVGAPTWCRSIAQATAGLLSHTLNETDPRDFTGVSATSGIYNVTCSGQTTWYEFAEKIVRAMNLPDPPKLIPIPTSDYPTPATRPLYSLLSNDKIHNTFGVTLPEWETALNSCLEDGSEGLASGSGHGTPTK